MTTPQAHLMHKQEYELRIQLKQHKTEEIKRLIREREQRTGQILVAELPKPVLGSKRIHARK
jgi:hypothetical protein